MPHTQYLTQCLTHNTSHNASQYLTQYLTQCLTHNTSHNASQCLTHNTSHNASHPVRQSPMKNHLGQRHKLINASRHPITIGGSQTPVYGAQKQTTGAQHE
eukprot:SAG31_NODE_2935_length_4895_cov_5.362177_2_plen_101_part_00